jgi:uncharacterized protein (DUF885 family)
MRHSILGLRYFPLLAALLAALAGIARAPRSTTFGAPPAVAAPAIAAASGDPAFRALVDRFIEENFKLNPEAATWAGDHRYDGEVSDLSANGVAARIQRALEWKERFSRIDPATLSPAAEADREWLLANCDGDLLDDQEIRTYQRQPAIYLPTPGIYALLERDFAPLAKRMSLVAAREQASLKNFQAARDNLVPGKMPKVAAQIVATEMEGTLGFFAVELPTAFAAVPDGPAKAQFRDANGKTIAALHAYQKWLAEVAAPKASDNFAIGADAYRRMLADDDMVDVPLPQLEQLGEQELARLQTAFTATAAQIDPTHSPTDILRAIGRRHPAADQAINVVAAGLAEIRAFVVAHHLATIDPNAPDPIVRETPPYMRATTFASMDSPGPFEKSDQAYFNVTLPESGWSPQQAEQALEFFSPPMISDVSVHEVYPGHYVQFLDNRRNSDQVRSLFRSGANVEGWGLYCEQMMLEQGLRGGNPAYRLAELQMALQRACRFLVGLRMHTRGMTVPEATAFFERNAYMTPHSATMEALRGTQDPGYLRYQLGKLMILKLRDDVHKQEGAAFDLGRFHDDFLRQGALPLKLIRRLMLGADGSLL